MLAAIRDGLCRDAGVRPSEVARIGLGLNGIDFPDEFAMQHAALAAALDIPPERLGLVNDGIDLFLTASGASDGHVAFNTPGSALDSHSDGLLSLAPDRLPVTRLRLMNIEERRP